ncbi:hypothetical protein [Labilibaculum manganireducens]|uniref:hypothetical protein n=1 Tax=Labilibaculum manganireducens TaxID=1940525 RepID=UPI0029F4B9E0|nr:hypothetical protein [Labilibaculum manganireducens]
MDLKGLIENQKISKEKDIDSSDLEVQIKRKKLENNRFDSDTYDRKWLAKWTAIVVTFWLFLVLAIVCLSSVLKLSDTVLVTLLGTTTLNVLGLSFIVLRGHFNTAEVNSE